jgi:hypothetical protein
MSRLLEKYFQDVEDELEELQYEEEKEINTLQTIFEITQEEEKYETYLKEIVDKKNQKEKKNRIKKQKTFKISKKIEEKSIHPTIHEVVSVQNFRPKIIKDFKSLDEYSKKINYKPEKVFSSSSTIFLDDISQIKRKNFASAFDGSTLVIHGGEDEEGNSLVLIFNLNFRIG